MLNKKNIIVHLLSLCVLSIGFVLCRYVFFDIHGIKQLPVWLFVVGVVSMAVSFFLEGKTTPICTALPTLLVLLQERFSRPMVLMLVEEQPIIFG